MGTMIQKPYGYIYKTTLPSGKFYIGQHKGSSFDKHYVGSGVCIKSYLKKHPKELLSVEILDWADSLEELNKKEAAYISQVLDKEDNLNLRAGGNQPGYSEEILNKIKKNSCGPKTLEGKRLISEANKKRLTGVKRPEEVKKKISQSSKGRTVSKEAKQKNREKHLGRKLSEETRVKLRAAAIAQWKKQHAQIGG